MCGGYIACCSNLCDLVVVQGKKRGKRRTKAATTTQQKTVGERKPVASDRAVKDVCFRNSCSFLGLLPTFFSTKILGELYVDREYLSNLIKDPGKANPSPCVPTSTGCFKLFVFPLLSLSFSLPLPSLFSLPTPYIPVWLLSNALSNFRLSFLSPSTFPTPYFPIWFP